MKKVSVLIAAISCIFLLGGCANNAPKVFDFKNESTAGKVSGWVVYTNPAFRYELRYPQSWMTLDSGEDGLTASFQPAGKGTALTINGYTNWQNNYSLEDFYKQRNNNLFAGDYERQIIKVGGQPATWFKKVPSTVPGAVAGTTMDVIVLNLQDRIIEIDITGAYQDCERILNTLKFY